jgi:hypothetical protein
VKKKQKESTRFVGQAATVSYSFMNNTPSNSYTVVDVLDEPRNPVSGVSLGSDQIDPLRLSIDYQTRRQEVQDARASLDANRITVDELKPEIKKNLEEDYHMVPLEDLLKAFGVKSVKSGLSIKDAQQKLAQNGPNIITPPKKLIWKILHILSHFFTGFCLLLWPASILCFIA